MRVLFYLSCVIFSLDLISAFNFDVDNPIIIKNSFQPKSQFGASVTFVTGESSSWIIIGAPKGNTTLFNQADIVEPGVLWRCSLGKSRETCEILETDSRGNVEREHHDKGGKIHHRKDGGRLGESSFIGESDRFVTCAPRWSNQRAAVFMEKNESQSHYFMNGICYWRPKAEIIEDILPSLLPNHTLIPLRNQDRQAQIGSTERFEWIFGEAGFSMHLTKDNEMILGAPGVENWRGSVIRLSDTLATDAPLRRNGLPNPYAKVFRAPPLVSRPELDATLTTTTYFGYAVTSGKYFLSGGNTPTQFASGAPRGGLNQKLTGHVTIFFFPERDDQVIFKIQEIDGPVQVGSYFGSVLCSVDLNKDGRDDLLVGAPRYSSRTEPLNVQAVLPSTSPKSLTKTFSPLKQEFTGYGDEGAVFVYLSDGTQMLTPIRIGGSNKPWSYFGSAITSVGDINHDGYNDVAIGAPREDSRRGAVYIYHGGESGLETKHSQVIYAKDLDSSLLGFGHSFSLGIDIDKNNYNDLAVGAYASGHAVILRSRPIVTISGSVTSSMFKINLNTSEFSFESCVSYTGYNAPSELSIRVHLSSDADNTKLGRVHIKIPGSKETNQSYVYIEKTRMSSPQCRTFDAVVIRSLTLSHNAVVLRQEVYLEDEMESKLKRPTIYNIRPGGFGSVGETELDTTGPGFNSFCKSCPRRDLSKKNYVSLSLPLGVACGDDDVCLARLKVEAMFQNISQDTFIMGTAKSLVLHIVVTNTEETAFEPGVTVSWMKRNLVALPPNCGYVAATNNLSCTFGQILRSGSGQSKHLFLEYEMNDLVAGEQNTLDEFILIIETTTTSNVTEVGKLDKILRIKALADIWVSGNQKIVHFYETNPSQIFTHAYNISLEGPSTLSRVELLFDVPLRIKSISETEQFITVTSVVAKHDGQPLSCRVTSNDISLLHNVEKPLMQNGFDPDLDAIDDDSHDAEEIGKDLRKRDLDSGPNKLRTRSKRGATNTLTVNDKVIQVDCSNADLVDCAQVKCLIGTFKPDTLATVEISMKISTNNISDLMKQYKADGVRIQSRGRALNVKKDVQPFPHNPDTYDCFTTISSAIDKTPAWVIPASVISTLLFLLCIAFCLWLMGVFDRKKRIPQSEVIETQGAESIPLNDQRIEDDDEVVDEVFSRNSYERR